MLLLKKMPGAIVADPPLPTSPTPRSLVCCPLGCGLPEAGAPGAFFGVARRYQDVLNGGNDGVERGGAAAGVAAARELGGAADRCLAQRASSRRRLPICRPFVVTQVRSAGTTGHSAEGAGVGVGRAIWPLHRLHGDGRQGAVGGGRGGYR